MEPAIFSLHVEDEVDEPGRPFTEAAITRVAVEVEKKYHGARSVASQAARSAGCTKACASEARSKRSIAEISPISP